MSERGTGIDRRRFGRCALGAGALLAAPFVLPSRARARIGKGDELTVGIWGGAQERITREHVAKPLEERYGVRVNFVLGGSPERRARAYAERGRPSFDVVYLNVFESRQAVRDGVTQPPSEAVPGFARLHPIARQGGYGVAFNPITIVYDRTKTAPIASWRDLWRPELKGRISFPTYPGAQGTAGLVMAARAWGGDERDLDVAFRRLAELKPFVTVHNSQDQLYALFDQGAVDAAIEFGSFSRTYAETRNPRIEIAAPSEGQAIAVNVACVTVGTRNQRLAEEWIDLHLSAPCQLAYARQMYYSPTVRDLEVPEDLKPKLVLGEAQVSTLVDFDWDVVTRNQSAWAQRFNRELAS